MDIKHTLGKRIREQRVALGISQEDLAHFSGLHRTYIGSVERGERNVSVVNNVSIARALPMTPSELFEGIK